MFGHTFKVLTEASNHYVDFSRAGELVASKTHRYNQSEILTRGAMGVFAIAAAIVGGYLNNSEKTGRSDLTIAAACGILGLAIAHIPIIYPLIKKRFDMSVDCDEIAARIHAKLDACHASQELRDDVDQQIQAILCKSLSNDEHANASLTWGTRKSMLTQLEQQIDDGLTHGFSCP